MSTRPRLPSHRARRYGLPALLLIASAVPAGLAGADAGPAANATFPGAAWPAGSPGEAGMDPSLLDQARNHALAGGGSGLVIRGGKAVYSWGSLDDRYDLRSTTKSIGVTALGLALQDGLVNIDDRAQVHLPTIGIPPESNGDSGWLAEITLRQLANHSAGFAKPGGYVALLQRPGTAWAYSDGGSNWLADVLTVRFGTDLHALMSARVFTPLGIDSNDLTWRSHNYRESAINGIPRREFGSGIKANVDAMARLGYLYLHDGNWASGRILPPGFVDDVRRPDPGIAGLPVQEPGEYPGASSHYGLLWWNNGDGSLEHVPEDAYWAWGLSDSLILVVPSLDLVVSRAGNGWRAGWNADYEALRPFFEPLAWSITGLPAGTETRTLAAVADTYSNSSTATQNFGRRSTMRVHGPSKKLAFIDFEGVAADELLRAELRLFVREVVAPGLLRAHAVQDDWSELTLTHASRPGYGAALSRREVGAGDTGKTITLDVTSIVRQWTAAPAADHGIALTSPDLHLVLDTREGGNPPALFVMTRGPGSNARPTVVVDSPGDGAVAEEGQPLFFSATASDAEDGDISNGLAWVSDRDGQFGAGAAFSTTALSTGVHTITARVTDSGGKVGTDTVQVRIDEAGGVLLTVEATADTFSNRAQPDTVFGRRKVMRVHGPGDKKIAFAGFDASRFGTDIVEAMLKLTLGEVVAPGVLDLHYIDEAWDENTLTHATRPALDAALVSAAIDPADAGTVVTIDVTSIVRQWALSPTPALGIAGTSGDNLHVVIQSREASRPAVLEIRMR